MIGLQWRPGKQARKPQAAPVVISDGPATPAIERATPEYDPFAAYRTVTPAPADTPRKRGRPRKGK